MQASIEATIVRIKNRFYECEYDRQSGLLSLREGDVAGSRVDRMSASLTLASGETISTTIAGELDVRLDPLTDHVGSGWVLAITHYLAGVTLKWVIRCYEQWPYLLNELRVQNDRTKPLSLASMRAVNLAGAGGARIDLGGDLGHARIYLDSGDQGGFTGVVDLSNPTGAPRLSPGGISVLHQPESGQNVLIAAATFNHATTEIAVTLREPLGVGRIDLAAIARLDDFVLESGRSIATDPVAIGFGTSPLELLDQLRGFRGHPEPTASIHE